MVVLCLIYQRFYDSEYKDNFTELICEGAVIYTVNCYLLRRIKDGEKVRMVCVEADCVDKYEKNIKMEIKVGAFGFNRLQGGPKVLTPMKNRDRIRKGNKDLLCSRKQVSSQVQ